METYYGYKTMKFTLRYRELVSWLWHYYSRPYVSTDAEKYVTDLHNFLPLKSSLHKFKVQTDGRE